MLFTCSDNQNMAIDFRKLECLRLFCRQILQDQVASLKYFEYDVGYQHYRGKNKMSVSSSATCVLSLVATDSWKAKANKAQTKGVAPVPDLKKYQRWPSDREPILNCLDTGSRHGAGGLF